MKPGSYIYLDADQWRRKKAAFDALAAQCTLCPRQCGVQRFSGRTGYCQAPNRLIISSIFPHFGEEPPISGARGSGTVFFAHCTLKCVYCQNYQLSHLHEGREYTEEELAARMVWLQEQGCHNINLVTPAHFLPWIVRAIEIACRDGLTAPIVYNCGGYESVAVIEALEGIVDIYLPDMKYGADAEARLYSAASDYTAINRAAIAAMFRQTGPLRLDSEGIAVRGTCIRHLALPHNKSHSDQICRWLSERFDPADLYISLMAQYHPCYRAAQFEELCRPVDAKTYRTIMRRFRTAGFEGFYQNPRHIDDSFLINFAQRKHEPLTGD